MPLAPAGAGRLLAIAVVAASIRRSLLALFRPSLGTVTVTVPVTFIVVPRSGHDFKVVIGRSCAATAAAAAAPPASAAAATAATGALPPTALAGWALSGLYLLLLLLLLLLGLLLLLLLCCCHLWLLRLGLCAQLLPTLGLHGRSNDDKQGNVKVRASNSSGLQSPQLYDTCPRFKPRTP